MRQKCSGCGLSVPPNSPSCPELFDQLIARDFSDFRYGRVHRLAVDCYALQHPGRYCSSAKSLMAHLAGLCIALECESGLAAYQALQRSLNGNPPLARPAVPAFRGSLTIAHVQGACAPGSYASAVKEWAGSVWQAYSGLHDLARHWLEPALAQPRLCNSAAASGSGSG